MDSKYTIYSSQDFRNACRKYVIDILHLKIRDVSRKNPLLNKHFFFGNYDNEDEKSKEKAIQMKTVVAAHQELKVSFHVQEGDCIIYDIEMETTDTGLPVVHLNAVKGANSIHQIADTTLPGIKTLSSLINHLTDASKGRSLMIQFDKWYPKSEIRQCREVFPEESRVLLVYVRTIEQYDLMLREKVYYSRWKTEPVERGLGAADFEHLPDYLMVLPFRGCRIGETEEDKTYVEPYTIRLFRIRKEGVTNGYVTNQELREQWNLTNFNPDNQHCLIHLESEPINVEIDQRKGLPVMERFIKGAGYIPKVESLSTLLSYSAFRLVE